MEHHTFILYVAGDGELAVRARANFDRLIQSRLGGHCSLTIIDVLKEPGVARQNRVVATPLLVRERPPPLVKVLGDLSHEAKILAQLGLDGLGAESDGPGGRNEGNEA
jgi:circadian clock protein KaiB